MRRFDLKCTWAVRGPVHPGVIGLALLLSPVLPARGSQLTNVQTIFLVMMENKGWKTIRSSSDCPYINQTLLPLASRAEEYFTPPNLHPSEPNYIWLEAGTNFGILNDHDPGSNHISSTNHLVTLLENAGISWKTYQESLDLADNPSNNKRPYVARHNPFIFFDDVATNQARRVKHIRPYSELESDLKNNNVARYNFIVPNLTNDMHTLAPGSLSEEKQGDDWLAREVPKILSSAAYTNNGALFLLWDEGDNDVSDGPIGLLLLSSLAKGHGYTNNIHYTHSSMLRTVEEIFGVRPVLGDAANANDVSDLFADHDLRLSAARNSATGGPEATVTGIRTGTTNLIQTSTNLLDWFDLSAHVATTNALGFTDTVHTNAHPRFYRVLELH